MSSLPYDQVTALSDSQDSAAQRSESSVVERSIAVLPWDGAHRTKSASKSFETIESILLTEPRIEFIRKELRALLRLVSLELDGKTVEVDAFRLKEIARWADYPSSLSEIFWHLSSVCNFSCEFCYEKGNPPGFPIQNTPRMATEREVATRIRYYDPTAKRGIFSVRTAINEPFTNRNAGQFLRHLREKDSSELISFVTNGAYFTESLVRTLSEVSPVFFNLSLYSTDPGIRKETLRDRRGAVALEALPLLKRYEVPYMANVVVWPSIPLSDIRESVLYAAANGCVLMRVCLGGYSKYLPGTFDRFNPDDLWPQVIEFVEQLRQEIEMPILIEPSAYVRRDFSPVIDGAIFGSPAHRVGLRCSDVIVAVNGRTIRTRLELASVLRRGSRRPTNSYVPPGVAPSRHSDSHTESTSTQITVRRNDHEETYELSVDHAVDEYPYSKVAAFGDFPYGIVLTDCLSFSAFLAIQEIFREVSPTCVLLLSSKLMAPIVEAMAAQSDAFGSVPVHIRVPDNKYFGGSINVGDLLVVSDFIEAIRSFLAEGFRPDLVLIPASPFSSSPWGRDLTGVPWHEIGHATHLAVRLIPCATLTY